MEHAELLSVFGSRIKKLRKARGWTQAEVARRAHVSVDFLGKAERGTKEPSLFVLLKLATVFEVSPAFLLTPRPVEGSVLEEIQALLLARSAEELAWIKRAFILLAGQPAPTVLDVAEPRLPQKYGRPADGRVRGKKKRRKGE